MPLSHSPPFAAGFPDPVPVAHDRQAAAHPAQDAQHGDHRTRRRSRQGDAAQDVAEVGAKGPGADQEAHEHQADEHLHDGQEEPETACPDQDARGQGVDDPPLRDREAWENRVAGNAGGRKQSAADQEGPDEEIEQEEILDGPAEALHPAFQERGTRRELPASDAFVQGELEHGAPDEGPQQHRAEVRAGVGGRNHVPGADARGRDGDPRSHEGEHLEEVQFQVVSGIRSRPASFHRGTACRTGSR